MDNWISVEDRLPEIGQVVDIWQMPSAHEYCRALSLKDTTYGKQRYNETYYRGWRSTNYKYSIEIDNDGAVMNLFTACDDRYGLPFEGYNRLQLCVENGEVLYWMPQPTEPNNHPFTEREQVEKVNK